MFFRLSALLLNSKPGVQECDASGAL